MNFITWTLGNDAIISASLASLASLNLIYFWRFSYLDMSFWLAWLAWFALPSKSKFNIKIYDRCCFYTVLESLSWEVLAIFARIAVFSDCQMPLHLTVAFSEFERLWNIARSSFWWCWFIFLTLHSLHFIWLSRSIFLGCLA